MYVRSVPSTSMVNVPLASGVSEPQPGLPAPGAPPVPPPPVVVGPPVVLALVKPLDALVPELDELAELLAVVGPAEEDPVVDGPTLAPVVTEPVVTGPPVVLPPVVGPAPIVALVLAVPLVV